MISGLLTVFLATAFALWINDYTPWGGRDFTEEDF
jgi:hypothetical protein